MDFAEELALDSKKEEEGVWFEYGKDAKILVARIGNPKYNAAMERMARTQRGVRHGARADEMARKMVTKALAAHCLLGWENVVENKKPVPYSPVNALRLLEKYSVFRDDVLALAS